ncbi:MAG TPA: GAF domain-containing protein [Anaerolineae bacterium]|nr:GAF domain-containing protein [Anaerolineae bacterium]
MTEDYRSLVNTTVSETERREQLFRQVILLTLGVFTLFWGVYIVGWYTIPDFPQGLLVWGGVALALMSGTLWLVRRKQFKLALSLYLSSLSFILFIAMHYMRGVTGPIAIALPAIPLIAGSLVGRRGGLPTLVVNVALYALFLILEYLGVVTPYAMPSVLMWVFWGATFFFVSFILLMINGQLAAFMQESLETLRQQQRDLAVATQRAQAAVEAERELRRRDAQSAEQLDNTLKQYVNFLELIRAGDYALRLDMNEMANNKNLSLSLINLGRYLNATVESLVEALTEVQSVQQAYVQRSWESLTESGTTPSGYVYRGDEVLVNHAVWLPAMTEAVRTRNLTVTGKELAIPLQTRGQIIGAVGARRDETGEWSAEELEIVNAVADQLAQTIENLRLLDDTNRRAAREQASSEVTAQIRAEVEIEAVLERALMELGRALNAERGAARLTLGAQQEESL